MDYIIPTIIYYFISSLIFLKLYQRETLFGILSTFGEIMCFIPIVRFIYYVHMKF